MVPTIALLSWPLIAICFHLALGPARGMIWAVTIGYLFLPEAYGFDLPGLPAYEKGGAIALGLILGLLVSGRKAPAGDVETVDRTFRLLLTGFLLAILLAPVGTWLTNPETLVNGPEVRRGLGPNDVLSMLALLAIPIVPFLVAWRILARPEHQRELLFAVVVLGLAYTFLALYEVRMSPQLNKTIYGYFPHAWRQHLRGGFRPLVFLNHGLSLGFFLVMVILAALALMRDRKTLAAPMIAIAIWTGLTLVLSKNLGATMLAAVFVPVMLFVGTRAKVILAVVIAANFLAYPALKHYDLAPIDRLTALTSSISQERTESFVTRLENEAELVDRAWRKKWFGWGLYGRTRIFDERGRDQTLIDGGWIVSFSQTGWVGYLGLYGMLSLPIFFLFRAGRRKEITPVIAGMVAIVAANFVYLIPNSTLNPMAMMMFGALAAFVQRDVVGAAARTAVATTPAGRSPNRYTRFPNGGGSAPLRTARGPGTVSEGASRRTRRDYARTLGTSGGIETR